MSESTIAGEQPLVALRRVMAVLRDQETLDYTQWLWCERQRDALLELAISELQVTDRPIIGDDIAAILYEVDTVNQLLALSQARVQSADRVARHNAAVDKLLGPLKATS